MNDAHAWLNRRSLTLGLAAVGCTACAANARTRSRAIVVLGDSITAGYGLPHRQALPAQLQAALDARGAKVRVIGAGVSGDTTADALRRVDRAVPAGVDLCLVALGGNDLLQEVPPERVRWNLEAIVRRLKARHIPVALAGMRAPPILDPAYVRRFDAVFGEVAQAEQTPLYPFLLEGVALDPRLNQPDRIHPNSAGVRIIAARLAPFLVRAARL